MEVNISHLRRHLPEYLARVNQGERVRVTSRGRVVAELVPPTPPPTAAAAARQRLKGSLVRYEDPTASVFAEEEWDMLRP